MNQPWNEVKASSIAGVVLDCDLSTGTKIGGGTATDNTSALNALLATASATNPLKLILDGPSLVTGLNIAAAGYTVIEGIGWTSGVWVKSASNADAINNGRPASFDPGPVAPAQAGPVTLKNFKINGNRGNGTTGNSNSGNPRGNVANTYWFCNVNLISLSGVHIEDMYIYDAPAYSIRISNCSDVVVANNTIINPNVSLTANQDGVHVDGPASKVRICGNYINNNLSDDAIALNAPEGYSGIIDDAVIENNTIVNCSNAFRIYGASAGQVNKVVVANNTGSTSYSVFIINATTVATTGDLVRELVASNNVFTSAGRWVALSGGAGDLTFSNCVWLNPFAAASFIQGVTAGTVSSVTIDNCHIYRTTAGNNTASTLLAATAAFTFKRFTINGFSVMDEQGQSYAAIANVLAMTNIAITQLYVAALDYALITALADSYTNIASISGGAWQPESNIQSKTGAYTLLPTDRTVLGNTTAAGFSVALPAKSYAGEKHTIKNTGTANTLTVTGTVDGSANPTLTTLAKMTVEYDGTNWWTV